MCEEEQMAQSVEVTPGVRVFTSRKMLRNSTVLSAHGSALLVDPGWMPDELSAIAAELSERKPTVIGGFATLAHHDHLLWYPGFGSVLRWASAMTAQLARSERDVPIEHLGPEFPATLVDLMGQVEPVVEAIPEPSIPQGFEIELIVHGGHAPGHTALWLPEQRVLIAGDMLSDVELPLPFYLDDVPASVDALDRLAPFASRAEFVVPRHGHSGTNAFARLEADRRYIDNVVRSGGSDDRRAANSGMVEAHSHLVRLASGG